MRGAGAYFRGLLDASEVHEERQTLRKAITLILEWRFGSCPVNFRAVIEKISDPVKLWQICCYVQCQVESLDALENLECAYEITDVNFSDTSNVEKEAHLKKYGHGSYYSATDYATGFVVGCARALRERIVSCVDARFGACPVELCKALDMIDEPETLIIAFHFVLDEADSPESLKKLADRLLAST